LNIEQLYMRHQGCNISSDHSGIEAEMLEAENL
jgi:hypothetical protein